MFQTWFKIFFRNQKKNWLNIVINVSGLTLGLAGLLIVLVYFHDEQSYNRWNPNKEVVYRISNKSKRNGIWHVGTVAQTKLYKEKIPEVTATIMSDHLYRGEVITYNHTNFFSEKVLESQGQFFDFFPFIEEKGSFEQFKKNDQQVALSTQFAKRIFGNNNPVNKRIRIKDEEYTIACVYAIPGNSHYQPEIIYQYDSDIEPTWSNFRYEIFFKVNEGAKIEAVVEKMNKINIDEYHDKHKGNLTIEEFGEKFGFMTVIPEKLADIRLHPVSKSGGPEGRGNYQLLLILLGLSILLIIISCINFINLSTASVSQRAKEVGVKKTLGLSKKQLIVQYVSEIVFQGMLALIFALIIVELILPYFNDFIGKELTIHNPSILLKIVITAIVISVIVGIIPAIYWSNFKTVQVLKGNFSRSKKGIHIRNGMLGFQFLISGFFLIGVLVIYHQINYMISKDVGFDKEQIIVVTMYDVGEDYKKYQLTRKELTKHPNITAITSSMFVPGEGFVNGTNLNDGKDISFSAATNPIDFNYINFSGIKIVKGRDLSEKFSSDTINNILINETAAKRLDIYNDPIGKKLGSGWIEDDEPRLVVVGMIEDYHFDGFDSKIAPMFLAHWNTFSFAKNWISSIQFKVKTEDVSKTIADIEAFWRTNIDEKYPFEYEFLDKKFAKTYEKYQKQQSMFLVLSVVVIIISLLGLFALATLTIQQRLKEVAIRKTLGASIREIMFQLIKSFLKITLIASVILLPLAYYFMQNWLDNFVYRIEMPWWPFICTPVLLVVLVFAVVGFKAYRATKVDLIKYLKFE